MSCIPVSLLRDRFQYSSESIKYALHISIAKNMKNRSPILLIITNVGSPINNRTVVYINMKMSRLASRNSKGAEKDKKAE